MKKFYLLTMSACMLSSFAIAEVSEKHVKRDLFGDSMGDTEDVSRFTEYYYDVEGINCKSIETGIGIKTTLESLFCDYVYVYDSINLLLDYYGIKNTDTVLVKD